MKRLAVLLGTIGALFFGGAIYAQQAKTVGIVPAVLTTGDYRVLSWFRWVKLGSAPYVNPDLMDDVTIAFTYDSHEVLGMMVQKEAMVEELMSGKVAAAIPSSGTLKVHAYKDPIWFEKYGVKWEDLKNANNAKILSAIEGQNMMFISQDERLFDLGNKGKVVSWKKGVAVTAGSEELLSKP